MEKLIKDITEIATGKENEVSKENANKDARTFPTRRDLIAGAVSKQIAKTVLPEHIYKAHVDGDIHYHDMDYAPAMPFTNCCLVNLKDMLENGFKLGSAQIESPKSIGVACAVTAQIIAQVASHQYGGTTIANIDQVLAPYVKKTYYKHLADAETYGIKADTLYAQEKTEKETLDGYNHVVNMEAVLLTIALLYMIWSVAVLVFDADIWLKNKLKADKPKYEAKESPPPRGDDFIVKHTYTVSPKTDSMEQVKPKEEGETVKESEVTFEDDKLPKKSARIPDDKLDEAFTDTRIEDVDVEFDDSEEEPTVEQASGNSFEEIDKAVETATKPNVTNEECVHAGKVFSEMEGNELFNMIAERSKIIKRRIDALMELHMSNISSDKPMSGKATKVIKKKKLVVPEDFKDFNIRDFV